AMPLDAPGAAEAQFQSEIDARVGTRTHFDIARVAAGGKFDRQVVGFQADAVHARFEIAQVEAPRRIGYGAPLPVHADSDMDKRFMAKASWRVTCKVFIGTSDMLHSYALVTSSQPRGGSGKIGDDIQSYRRTRCASALDQRNVEHVPAR